MKLQNKLWKDHELVKVVIYQLLAWLKRYCNNTIFEYDIWTERYLFSKLAFFLE